MKSTFSSPLASGKPHYELLDGLRGVAALAVIWFHFSEGFSREAVFPFAAHGFLAVDFFFVLSGFVIGYAYDDRWGKGLTMKDFAKRRLIRLHPLVVFAVLLGAVSYLLQGSVTWQGEHVPLWRVGLATLTSLFMIPAWPGAPTEVRGFDEMFPLNGPMWSLFFEYIGNLLYALLLRRLSTRFLGAVVVLAAGGLVAVGLLNPDGAGNLGGGWSLGGCGFLYGLLRMMFAYSMGLWLARIHRPRHIRYAFAISALALIALLAVPRFASGYEPVPVLPYQLVVVIVLFPLLVWVGANGTPGTGGSSRLCRFLGDISYPLYIIQYPFMYLLYAYLWRKPDTYVPLSEEWPLVLGLFVGLIVLAYVVFKCYDEPVRRWLTRLARGGNAK